MYGPFDKNPLCVSLTAFQYLLFQKISLLEGQNLAFLLQLSAGLSRIKQIKQSSIVLLMILAL